MNTEKVFKNKKKINIFTFQNIYKTQVKTIVLNKNKPACSVNSFTSLGHCLKKKKAQVQFDLNT